MTPTIDPTSQLYGEFRRAFDYFNIYLFGTRLRPVMVTLKTKPRSMGHYAVGRFAAISDHDTRSDEIAMNPVAMMQRPVYETLSTLVHEMVHLEQQMFGKPGKGAHHNVEWVGWMERLGLIPSDTGAPGGKKTGNKVSHYVVEGGPFDIVCKRLLDTGFTLSWADLGAYDGASGKSPKAGKRVKYVCPLCEQAAWAKHDAKLVCGECSEDDLVPMIAED
jgi:predicted SprT family Zn-dependent metalloprotease